MQTYSPTLYLLIGTALALLGFLQWPKRSWDLMRPRFVVPLMIYNAVFMHYLIRPVDPLLERYHTYYDADALRYTCFCLVGFWIGFILPFGAWLATPLTHLPSGFYWNLKSLRWPAILLVTLPFFIVLVLSGPNMFVAGQSYEHFRFLSQFSVVLKLLTISVDLMVLLGAVLVGFAWPTKHERNFFNTAMMLFALFLGSQVYMSRLSRASGLLFVLAFVGASVRSRKINWPVAVLVAVVFMVCAHTGLSARQIYGHYAGNVIFFQHMFAEAMWDWKGVLTSGITTVNSLSSLVVSMYGADRMNLGQLSPAAWFANQIPIPRFLGLPQWTADASTVIPGRPARTFTFSIFGDTYAHFGTWGAMLFVYVGTIFRMIDRLANTHRQVPNLLAQQQPWYVHQQLMQHGYQFFNIYLILMVAAYGAWARGLHNSFRAWQSLTFYSLYGVVLLALIMGAFLPRYVSGARQAT